MLELTCVLCNKQSTLNVKVRSTSPPSYLRRLIQHREHGHKLRSTSTTPSQPFTTTKFATRAFRHSSLAVWNSLRKTVLNSDSVAVFKSRLKTSLFPRLSLLRLLTNMLPAPAPLKIRPYDGATQICLLLLLLFYPSDQQCRGIKKLTL